MHALPLIAAVAVASIAPGAMGHGWMAVPSARQLRECGSPDAGRFLYPAGTGGGGSYEFEGGYPGLCGDGFMNRDRTSEVSTFHQQPCQQEPEVYQQGGEIQIEWMIIAPHGGFISCNICDDPNKLSEECFDKHPLMTCVLAAFFTILSLLHRNVSHEMGGHTPPPLCKQQVICGQEMGV